MSGQGKMGKRVFDALQGGSEITHTGSSETPLTNSGP